MPRSTRMATMSSLLLGRLRNCRTAGVSVGVRLFYSDHGVRRLFLPSRTSFAYCAKAAARCAHKSWAEPKRGGGNSRVHPPPTHTICKQIVSERHTYRQKPLLFRRAGLKGRRLRLFVLRWQAEQQHPKASLQLFRGGSLPPPRLLFLPCRRAANSRSSSRSRSSSSSCCCTQAGCRLPTTLSLSSSRPQPRRDS